MGKVVANGLQPIEVLRSTRLQNHMSLYTPYTMLGLTLQAVDHYPYLGVSLSENLNWKQHILNLTNIANLTLGFVKRNLHHFPRNVKDQGPVARSMVSVNRRLVP